MCSSPFSYPYVALIVSFLSPLLLLGGSTTMSSSFFVESKLLSLSFSLFWHSHSWCPFPLHIWQLPFWCPNPIGVSFFCPMQMQHRYLLAYVYVVFLLSLPNGLSIIKSLLQLSLGRCMILSSDHYVSYLGVYQIAACMHYQNAPLLLLSPRQ